MAHLRIPGQRHNRAVPSSGRYISLAGAALPCRGCVPSHGDIAVTIVPFVRLCEGFRTTARRDISTCATPCGPVAAEDVRDLQSWTGHGGPALCRRPLLRMLATLSFISVMTPSNASVMIGGSNLIRRTRSSTSHKRVKNEVRRRFLALGA